MKTKITAIATILIAGLVAQYASAESIPDWIRNNAMWWSEGTISQSDFVQGLTFLIQEDILKVPPTAVADQKSDEIPDWVKNNAKWWADGVITDDEFLNGVQYLIKVGLVAVPSSNQVANEVPSMSNSQTDSLQAELEACQEIKKAYDRFNCEDAVELKIKERDYKENGIAYEVGPITFYYTGADLEISQSGQANLSIKLLAKNTGSNDNVVLMCSGPSVCNYDVSDGQKAFKYSSTDFTSGQIAIKPGDVREINMLFGPNIGYGGTTFEYDSAKDYYFRISEPWGSTDIPLELK